MSFRIRSSLEGTWQKDANSDAGHETLTEESKGVERVTFTRGYDVCIMAIDGTWRRDCQLNAVSDTDAVLSLEGSIQGLNLKEFFLLLSSTGLAYRRCELVRVNGSQMDIQFIKGKSRKKKSGSSTNQTV
jgi:hypothetical protein